MYDIYVYCFVVIGRLISRCQIYPSFEMHDGLWASKMPVRTNTDHFSYDP